MEKQKKKRRGLKAAVIIEMLIICAVVGNLVVLGNEQFLEKQIERKSIKTTDIDLKSISVGSIQNTKELWLINASNPITQNIKESTMRDAYKQIALSRSDIKLQTNALEHLIDMFNAAKKRNITDMVITSGFRTYQKQASLYEQAEDKSFVQLPGCSEHESGLAADIQLSSGGMETLGETAQGRWLARNSWQYGFILRYPKDKISITGISYESWHFRYVGLVHAAFMNMKGLCFEEYIDYLKVNKQYAIEIGDISYQVYRTTAKNGKIEVPRYLDYNVSDDNCGGYIITVTLK